MHAVSRAHLCAVLLSSSAALAVAGACGAGPHANACSGSPPEAEDSSLVQLRSKAQRHGMRGDDAVKCPGSDAWCAGNQCCPGTAETNHLTFNCPTAEDSYKECQVAPTTPDVFTLDDLGPLLGLLGTWESRRGFNVISVPSRPPPGDPTGPVTFEMPFANYSETLTFEPILGGVKNRGQQGANQWDPPYPELDQIFLGVTYHQTIHQFFPPETGKPPELIHVENGQWLLNKVPGIDTSWTVGRMSLIPHGVSLMAMGSASNVSGQEVLRELRELNASVSTLPTNLGEKERHKFDPFDPFNPNRYDGKGPVFDPVARLVNSLETYGAVQYMEAVKLSVSTTEAGGNLGMMPNVLAQARATDFNSTFWIETWQYPDGKRREMLQYFQQVDLSFDNLSGKPECEGLEHPPLDCLVHWPHVMVNTLEKVSGYQGSNADPVLFPTIR